ncbi:MAG: hypothetical protein AB7N91_10515, partial [Candidatus Tectimicrobiota bacterium]
QLPRRPVRRRRFCVLCRRLGWALPPEEGRQRRGAAQQLDEHCRAAPFVDGEYVYFAGGASGLYRRKKDGSSPEAENIDDWCGAGPVIAGEHVYYLGTQNMNVLYRRLKDGLGASEPLDPNGAFRPWIDGQTIYWAGGPNRRSLYKGDLLDLPPNAYREWMRDHWSTIQGLPLWQVVIPGSHDSGCYGDRVFTGLAGYSALRPSAMSTAQGAPVGGQLRYGIRSFDLRFCPSAAQPPRYDLGQYYVFHGSDVYANTAATIISQVNDFLNTTSQEIVILNVRADAGASNPTTRMSPAETNWFANALIDGVGRNRVLCRSAVTALGCKTPPACTPAQLQSVGARVILLWVATHGVDEATQDYLWDGSDDGAFKITLEENFPSPSNVQELSVGRNNDLLFWANHWQVYQTQESAYWWRLGVHTTTGDLATGAAVSVPLVTGWLDNDSVWGTGAWNMVAADLLTETEYLELVRAIIDRNGKHRY